MRLKAEYDIRDAMTGILQLREINWKTEEV